MNKVALQENPEIRRASKLEMVLIKGDLSQLDEANRVSYYLEMCDSMGLNRVTRPFEYIQLNGKLTLYATKSCTDQLRKIHNVSIEIVSREKVGDVFMVTARATLPGGRCDESVGAVQVGTLKGDALANALMKAETKAKRRVTLSICGLGMLDEIEIDTIPHAVKSPVAKATELPKSKENEDEYVIPFGKKYKGKKISEIPKEELISFCEWLQDQPHKTGKQLSEQAKDFINRVEAHLVEIAK